MYFYKHGRLNTPRWHLLLFFSLLLCWETSRSSANFLTQISQILEEKQSIKYWKSRPTRALNFCHELVRTCSLEMISSLVMLTMLMSSTAKPGYEMMASTPASTSLEMEALGNMDVRMDWGNIFMLESEEADELFILMLHCMCVPGSAGCHQPERGPEIRVLLWLRTGWAHPAPPEPPEGHRGDSNKHHWKEDDRALVEPHFSHHLRVQTGPSVPKGFQVFLLLISVADWSVRIQLKKANWSQVI